MISYVRKIVPVIFGVIFLTGCNEEVKTVDWYLENHAERQAKFDECANDKAKADNDGNCKNAMSAELILTSGPTDSYR